VTPGQPHCPHASIGHINHTHQRQDDYDAIHRGARRHHHQARRARSGEVNGTTRNNSLPDSLSGFAEDKQIAAEMSTVFTQNNRAVEILSVA